MIPLAENFRPGPLDVICAKGKKAYDHMGNRRYRKLIEMNLDNYNQAKNKLEKSLIVSSIVNAVRRSSPEGGFVKEVDGKWYEVGDHIAREKVGQGFRDILHTKYKSSTKAKKRRQKEMDSKLEGGEKESVCSAGSSKKEQASPARSSEEHQMTAFFNQANSRLLQEIKQRQNPSEHHLFSAAGINDALGVSNSSSSHKTITSREDEKISLHDNPIVLHDAVSLPLTSDAEPTAPLSPLPDDCYEPISIHDPASRSLPTERVEGFASGSAASPFRSRDNPSSFHRMYSCDTSPGYSIPEQTHPLGVRSCSESYNTRHSVSLFDSIPMPPFERPASAPAPFPPAPSPPAPFSLAPSPAPSYWEEEFHPDLNRIFAVDRRPSFAGQLPTAHSLAQTLRPDPEIFPFRDESVEEGNKLGERKPSDNKTSEQQ